MKNDFKKIILQKIAIGYFAKIPEHMLQHMNISTSIDYLTNALNVHFESYLTSAHWTEKNGESKIIAKYPKTWLDSVRLRFAPKLLTKKYPIQYETVYAPTGITNNYWIFPDIPPNPNPDVMNFIMHYMANKKAENGCGKCIMAQYKRKNPRRNSEND